VRLRTRERDARGFLDIIVVTEHLVAKYTVEMRRAFSTLPVLEVDAATGKTSCTALKNHP